MGTPQVTPAAQATAYNSDPTMTSNPVQDSQAMNAPTPSGQDPSVSETTQPQNSTQVQPTQPQSAAPDQTVTPAPAQQQAAPHPWANAIKSTAEVLGGGPKFKTTVDPTTGQVTREQLPPDRRDIAWSIILTALSGSLSGLAAKGPNATGQAAALGLQQGQQIAQQKQQAQQQQSEDAIKDAQLQQTTAANNLKLLSLAQSVGKQSEDANASSVQNAAPMIKLAKDAGAVVAENVSAADASDLKKYPLGDYDRLPDGYHQRLDANGQPVFISAGTGQVVPEGTPGSIPAWDRTYTITNTKPVPLVDDSGKNLPWVASAIARGDIISNGGNIASSVRIPLTQAISIQRNEALTDAFENDVNRVRQANGLDPINVDADLKSNHSLQNAFNSFVGQLNGNGHQMIPALQAIAKTDPSAAGQIANYYGGTANLEKVDALTARTKVEQGYRINGYKSLEEAQQVAANPNSPPDLRKSAQARIDAETATKAQVAGAEERAKLPGELALKRAEASGGVGGLNTPAANAPPNAQGVNTEYIASLPATVRNQVQAIGEGRQAPPSRGSKQGIALMDMVNTAYPSYDGTKYQTYQTQRTKVQSGDLGRSLIAANTAIDHVAEMIDNATLGATLPGVGFIERGFGNQAANNLATAQHAVGEELGKAVKGGILSQHEAEQWQAQVNGWTPASVKSKGLALINLLKDRIDEQQENLDRLSVAGVSPIKVMSPKAQANYDRITGNQSQQQPQGGQQRQFTHTATGPNGQQVGWNGSAWVPITGGR